MPSFTSRLNPDSKVHPRESSQRSASMEGAGFWQQLKVLLWRNILLKKRNRGQLIQEILGPIYFVAILAMIKVLTKPARKPPMMFPPHDINSPAFGSPFVGNSTIFVSPDTAKVDGWMQDIIGQLSGGSPAYRLFATAEDAENEYRANSSGVGAGINFLVDGNQNSYNIRMGFGSLPSTTKLFDSNKGACRSNVNGTGYPGTCEVNKYLFTGFAQLQLAIENMLLREAGVTSPDPRLREVQVQMMDKDEFYPDTSYIQTISSIYFVFSFAFLANFLAVNLVAEKEKKIREGMLMMGLRSSVLWLSWALIYLALVMCVSLVLVAIIGGSEFFQHSNLFLVYISFVLYGGSIMAFAFMLTPLFNKAKVAGAITGFSTVIISLLYLIVSQTRSENSYNANIPPVAQWFMCLLSPIAFAATMDQGIFLDVQRDGFDFDESLTYGDFPLYAPILMMLIDIILYALLTIYLDHVVPGEYGTRYPPHYFLMPSYWCPSRDQGEKTRLIDMRQRTQSHAVDIEPVSQEMEENMAMRITSLTKAYKVEDKMNNVVDEFSLDIYKSQITCLLGHNGAGKTTLMNMLTGVVPPTSGVAQVMGLEITNSQQMEEIRKMCGICPQHNILYDALSCREHLELFASIKGVPDHQIKTAVEKAIRDVDLENQLETFSKDLSGGQKRKLSVAIALIGDPKLIFLDEPTAGMDPYSRRHLWSLLKEKKEGRVVLLTTHFMDEADILADRKAFIRKGKLRCCGSSLFLKNKFGIGYHLTMVVEPDSDTERIRECLHSEIPDIEQQRSHGKELAYTVPMQEVSKFGVLFGKLDEQSESLGIKSYGVSMTTLEEVFLKLEEDHVIDADSEEVGRRNAGFEANNEDVTLMMDGDLGKNVFTKSVISGRALWKQRFQALVKIRFLLMLRNSKALFWQLIFPIGLVTGGLVLAKSNSYQTPETPTTLLLQPSLYANVSGNGNLPDFLVFDSFSSAASQAVVDNFKQRVSVDAYKTGSVNTSDVAPHQIGLQMSRLSGQSLMNFAVLYNDSALHSIPTVISMASQSLLNMSGSSDLINGSSLPWPQLKVTVVYNGNTMGTTLMIGLAFLLVISGFASEAVQDRELKLRSQLRISGIDFGLYWGTMYLVDLISYLIPSLSIIIITLAMQVDGLSSPGAMGAAVLLFLTNIPFNIVLGLVISFIFDKTETCIAYLPHMISTPSMIPFVVVLMVDLVGQSADTAITLHYIFCVVDPLYTLYGGFYFIQRLYLLAQITGQPVEDSEYFKFDNHIMICVLMPVIHAMWMYWLLRILDIKKTGGRVLEAFPCLSKSKSFVQSNNTDVINNEDNDVKAERVRVEAMNTSEDRSQSPAFRLNGMSPKHLQTKKEPVAFMSQLRKVFEKRTKSKGMCNPAPVKSKVAVRNLSVAVDEGEVLGLLGPNGAGKSTALNMMIAETGPTCGKVVIGGHNIRSNMLSLLESLGYCPQHDALWELITLEEHIKCFAAIKGVAPQHLDSVTDFYISSLKLEEHRKKKAKKLSGGTKRKLSYIMSILGSPRLVLMDEPSTGMDPQSKRFLWDTISSSFQNTNKGAILTTHYMEEADALCSRVGIMVNGQLQCLGSTQHLKDTYGSGYILEVKLTGHEAGNVERLMDQLEAHLKTLFPGLDMVERFMERAQYSVPRDDVKSLGVTFSNLEECKLTHNLEEYSFSQSTLEQVFLYFAKQQLEEGKEEMVNTRESALPTSLRRRKTNGAVDV
ncbi:ATP-binding cassette sub-family A member 5 [Aplysia californica]|uniref:ATP-binding cassette sub-family A member 5 n=1 Tax=Aplysia californica TaxID=6500 RepID=A0ABM1VQW9_APLCA|nr:ATP-binding cassette sub-family A member 5 [Aplysia californica]